MVEYSDFVFLLGMLGAKYYMGFFKESWIPLKIICLSIVFGTLWILLSDKVELAFVDPTTYIQLHFIKGLFSVTVMACMLYFLIHSHLITKLKETEWQRINEEDELRSTKELLESFINNTVEAISVYDMNGNYILINKSFEKLYGWTEQELIGNRTQFKEYIDEINNWFSLVKSDKKVKDVESTRRRKDGKIIDISATVSPIRDSKGNIIAMATISRDITERKRAEELLRKSEKLAVVGQLAAGVAHEIRNPLTALKGFTQLISKQEGIKGYCTIMMAELERINDIVSEFLMIAKPQAENFAKKDLSILLKDVIKLLNLQAIMMNVQISIDSELDLPMITCDENQLKQVFVNILKNAIEAMPNGGNIVIRVRLNEQNQVFICIVDQGCGIPEERLSKLGEPFYTTKEKGTGLGLMVTHKIIEVHKGKIEFSSRVGEGTRVSILLPVSSYE